ncbi:MAG: hypothetical protein NZ533_00735 [Casimicrobiaceae bacterium]|nr:hypothetical protein [Casimicrobiaceae bacterium]MDW8311986.1 hypothetical protein [Burkholderiales bacterium]
MRPTDKERVLRLLEQLGGRASNARIQDHLGLSDERYAEIKKALLDEGLIASARGRGGGIRLLESKTSAVSTAKQPSGKESDLYEPFVQTLRRNAEDDELNLVVADISAMRLRGMWRNPDIVTVEVRNHQYLRTSETIVTTYELKAANGWNLNSAYEAAAHRRFANYAYLVIPAHPEDSDDAYEEITTACARLGVGLITLRKHYRRFRQSVLVEPENATPDLSAVNEFLARIADFRSGFAEDLSKLFEDARKP